MAGKAGNMKHGEERDEDDEGLHDDLAQIPDRFIVAGEEIDREADAAYSRYGARLPCTNVG